MAWQSNTVNPATTSPAADITKITNDLAVLRSVLGGGTDSDVPVNLGGVLYASASGLGVGAAPTLGPFEVVTTNGGVVAQRTFVINSPLNPDIGAVAGGLGLRWGNVNGGLRAIHGGDVNNMGVAFTYGASGVPQVEGMRLTHQGLFLVGRTTTTGGHVIGLPSAFSDAAPVANITGGSGSDTIVVYSSNGGGAWNAAKTSIGVPRNATTSRSINAYGTVNASGADYAEYERNNGLVIQKGAVVGFRADGTLTLTFDDAVRFGIKSTDPSYVGGDTWGAPSVIGERPAAPDEYATDEEKQDYADALAEFEARLEAERVKVDRVAYAGKVPVNVTGATPGGYIIASAAADGSITGAFVADPDFGQYKLAVGRVNRILNDGRAEVAVIIH